MEGELEGRGYALTSRQQGHHSGYSMVLPLLLVLYGFPGTPRMLPSLAATAYTLPAQGYTLREYNTVQGGSVWEWGCIVWVWIEP